MFRVTLAKGNESLNVPFKKPILDWQGAPARFFELIYGALMPQYVVATTDLSANAGLKLSDVWAKWQLRGTPSSITLFSDRLSFDFVSLLYSDYSIMYDIVSFVHSKFSTSFPGFEYDRVEIQSFAHFELLPPTTVEEYLNLYDAKRQLFPFESLGAFVDERIARFGAAAKDQSWRCRFGVDRSLDLTNGVFIDMVMTLQYKNKDDPFTEKLLLAQRVGKACRAALGLEMADV